MHACCLQIAQDLLHTHQAPERTPPSADKLQHSVHQHAARRTGLHAAAIDYTQPSSSHVPTTIPVPLAQQCGHTSNSLSAAQLMSGIKHAHTAKELEQLFLQSGSVMDHIHVAAMLSRLPHTRDGSYSQKPRLQPDTLYFMECLVMQFLQYRHYYRSRQLSSFMWALGKFHLAVAKSPICCQAALAVLHDLVVMGVLAHGNATDAANTTWALARLTQVMPELAISKEVQQQQIQQQHTDRAAEGYQGKQQQAWTVCLWRTLANLCQEQSHNFKAEELSNVLHAFAAAVPYSCQELLARAVGAVCGMASQLQPQHVANIAWAYAKAGHYDAKLFQSLAARAHMSAPSMTCQGITNTLWAFAKVGHVDELAVAALIGAAAKQLIKFRDQGLAGMIHALMQLGLLHQYQLFLYAVLQEAAYKMDEMRPLALATLLEALQHVQQQHKQLHAGSKAPEPHSFSTLPKSSAYTCDDTRRQQQQNSGTNRVQQGQLHRQVPQASHSAWPTWPSYKQERWFRLVYKRMSSQLPTYSAATLLRTIKALLGSGRYDRDLFEQLASACCQHAHEYSALECAWLLHAFSSHHEGCCSQLWSCLLPRLVGQQQQVPDDVVLHILWAAASDVNTLTDSVTGALLDMLHTYASRVQGADVEEIIQLVWAASRLQGTQIQMQTRQQKLQQHNTVKQQQQSNMQHLFIHSSNQQQNTVISSPLTAGLLPQPDDQDLQLPLKGVSASWLCRHVGMCLSATARDPSSIPAASLAELLDVAVTVQTMMMPGAYEQSPDSSVHYLQQLSEAALTNLGDYGPASLVLLYKAHSRGRLLDTGLSAAYADELCAGMANTPIAALIDLLAAFAQPQMRSRDLSLMQAAVEQLVSSLPLASGRQLTAAMQVLYNTAYANASVYRSAAKCLLGRLSECGTADVALVLHILCSMGCFDVVILQALTERLSVCIEQQDDGAWQDRYTPVAVSGADVNITAPAALLQQAHDRILQHGDPSLTTSVVQLLAKVLQQQQQQHGTAEHSAKHVSPADNSMRGINYIPLQQPVVSSIPDNEEGVELLSMNKMQAPGFNMALQPLGSSRQCRKQIAQHDKLGHLVAAGMC
eukprot:jgi/Chrzof1/9910/Cz04g20150.t1